MKELPTDLTLQQGSMRLKDERHSRLWEYASVLEHINLQDGQVDNPPKILDIGGAGSLLGFFLSANGANVWATDIIEENVRDATKTAERLGLLQHFTATRWNVADAPSTVGQFDIVVSVNVIEHVMEWARKSKDFVPGLTEYWASNHLPSKHEVTAEQKFVKGMADAVCPGGKLIITFDYKTTEEFKSQNRCAFIRSKEDLIERIVKISGLTLDGPIDLTSQKNIDKFCPNASTGIVILNK